ncbi:MAG: HlyC/CorC family transporter [Deltaproteobacteria bacterium]|nr:HlyC/CorC family transporter [Deltaproteobacteria bacterium]MBI4374144.1 HlyC/CorC family transporter [Deltaproteobacteria bacterium]
MPFEIFQLVFWSLFCLALEALFSGTEIALVSCDKLRLTHRAARGETGAKIALSLARRPEWFFSTTLLGQNLFIVGNTILVTFFIFKHWGSEYEFLGLGLAPIVLILGEAVPKSVFQMRAGKLATLFCPVVLVFSYLFYPVVWGLSKLTLLLFGGVKGTLLSGHQVTPESLELLIKDEEVSKGLSPDLKRMMIRILSFPKQRVHEIMTPLVDLFSFRDTMNVKEALYLGAEENRSLVPVFQRRAHDVVGVVSVYDLLFTRKLTAPVSQLMQPPLYVPELMSVKDLYLLLRKERNDFAVVVDEFGGAVGVVTTEDVFEKVVGEIQDEYDEDQKNWIQLSPCQYSFLGRTRLDQINENFLWELPKNRSETLAGFLIDQLGRFPRKGEIFHYGQLTFMVKEATPRSVDKIIVEIEEKT